MLHCHKLTLNRINYITYCYKQKYFLNASFTSSKKSHYFQSVLQNFFVQNVLFETGKELIKRKTINCCVSFSIKYISPQCCTLVFSVNKGNSVSIWLTWFLKKSPTSYVITISAVHKYIYIITANNSTNCCRTRILACFLLIIIRF